MADLMTIGAATLASLKTAADIAKHIRESTTTLEEAEIKLKLADLIGALADTKMEFAGIQNLVLEKDQEIKKLKDKLDFKQALIYEYSFYWLESEGKKDGPFCQVCHDKDQKLIRVNLHDDDKKGFCRVCKSTFYPKGLKNISFGINSIKRQVTEYDIEQY